MAFQRFCENLAALFPRIAFVSTPSVAVPDTHIGDNAYDHRNERAGSGRKSHRQQCVREALRHEINARNAHYADSDDIVQKGQPRPADGAEISAEAEVNARENAVPDISAQILPAGANDRRSVLRSTVGEERDGALRRLVPFRTRP